MENTLARPSAVVSLTLAIAGSVLSPTVAAPGDLNSSFGNNGVVKVSFDGETNGDGIAVQEDGRIVASGTGQGGAFYVTRRRPNGRPDKTFSKDGIKRIPIPGGGQAVAVAIAPDGKIVVVGRVFDTDIAIGVVRLRKNGSLDKTFSGDGRQFLDIDLGDDVPADLVVHDNGKIAVAFTNNAGSATYMAVLRLKKNGVLDDGFSLSGDVFVTQLGDDAVATGLALQRDGRLVVVGKTEIGANPDFGIARIDRNGTLDTESDGDDSSQFSSDGFQATTVLVNDFAQDVTLGKRGKIVVAGDSNDEISVVRYRRNGNLDTNFHDNGKVSRNLGGPPAPGTEAVTVQPDSKILVSIRISGGHEFALVRFRKNGSLDGSFGDEGMAQPGLMISHSSHDIAMTKDNQVVTVGDGLFDAGLRMILVKFLTGLPN